MTNQRVQVCTPTSKFSIPNAAITELQELRKRFRAKVRVKESQWVMCDLAHVFLRDESNLYKNSSPIMRARLRCLLARPNVEIAAVLKRQPDTQQKRRKQA